MNPGRCEECSRLESEYEQTLTRIRDVVINRFENPAEKLSALHNWQDRRDAALREFYEHRELHIRYLPSSKKKTLAVQPLSATMACSAGD